MDSFCADLYREKWNQFDPLQHIYYFQMGESLNPREHKEPLYRALYGLGCVTNVPIIRSGKSVGGRIGILPVEESIFTLKNVDEKSKRLIEIIHRVFSNLGY